LTPEISLVLQADGRAVVQNFPHSSDKYQQVHQQHSYDKTYIRRCRSSRRVNQVVNLDRSARNWGVVQA